MLAVHAGFAAALVGTLRPPPARLALRIAPVGAGTQDGSSWANAAPFSALNAMIAAAAAIGSEVWLRADQGSYALPAQFVINKGGVVVRGTDANGLPMKAELVGDRAPGWTVGQPVGSEHLWINSGASGLTFRDLRFRNAGTCFRLRQANSNLTFEDIEAVNVRRLIYSSAASGGTATISGMTIRRITGRGFSKQLIHVRYDSHDVLIEDVYADAERQMGDAWSQGIALDGTAHDVLIRRCHIINCGEIRDGYWNGDSYVGERGCYHIRARRSNRWSARV